MDTIIKEVANAGIGLGSLILFSFLFWQQMKILEKFKDSLDANTEVTRALTARIEQSMMVDQEVKSIMENYKSNK